jgi:hypothetical protein
MGRAWILDFEISLNFGFLDFELSIPLPADNLFETRRGPA